MRYAAININFDSLGAAYGFPPNYRDKSFTDVGERFLNLSRKYGFKYSIYVIGKDLEKSENREIVKEWSLQGHEIGNHSWSHPYDLGSMKYDEVRKEVELSHELISKTTGVEPKGFIAPNWSTSKELINVLIDLNYTYDTSSFPSPLMYLSLMKMLWNHRKYKRTRIRQILKRKDYLTFLRGFRRPYYTKGGIPKDIKAENGGLLILPLPVNRYRIPCWHTLGFVLRWKLQNLILRSCLSELDAFYYLVHPADLITSHDIDDKRDLHWERVRGSLEDKLSYLKGVLSVIIGSGRKIITMKELANKIQNTDLNKSQQSGENENNIY